jgi:hypothetical protein
MQLLFHYLLKAQSLRIAYFKCIIPADAALKNLCLIFLTKAAKTVDFLQKLTSPLLFLYDN